MTSALRLWHLNADSSWLLTLTLNDRRINILVDPWLHGTQVDFFPGFSLQSHRIEPAVANVQALEAEMKAKGLGVVDAVWISHDFSDHCHKETLCELSPDVPVFANTREAVSRLRGFKHFKSIVQVPYFGSKSAVDWQACGSARAGDLAKEQGVILPDYVEPLGFAYLPTTGRFDMTRLHGVALLTWAQFKEEKAACVLYAPHGLPLASLEDFARQHAEHLSCRLLMHSLDFVTNPWWLGGPVALGEKSAMGIAELFSVPNLVSTHDERDKHASGLIAHTLRRQTHSGVAALQRQLQNTRILEIPNGEAVDF